MGTGRHGDLPIDTDPHVLWKPVGDHRKSIVVRKRRHNEAGSSIPTGWTSLADMNGRFPRGSSTSGTTGGSDTHGSGHTVTLSALTVNAESASNRADVSLMTCALTTHTHTVVSATVATATALPPYVSYPFSYNPSLPYAFPINLVIMMNGALLSGWTQATELTNKFPRGGVFGTSGGSATHTHPISGSLSARRVCYMR